MGAVRRRVRSLAAVAFHLLLGSILARLPRARGKERRTSVAEDLERLSPRHHEVLGLIAEGASNKEIAILLNISQHTVEGYVEDVLLVLGVPNRAAAGARWATDQASRGPIDPSSEHHPPNDPRRSAGPNGGLWRG